MSSNYVNINKRLLKCHFYFSTPELVWDSETNTTGYIQHVKEAGFKTMLIEKGRLGGRPI